MRKQRKPLQRALSVLLALFVFASALLMPGLPARAANVTKTEKSYDIAVVFDNSGSMYDGTEAWCRAKYAMEIFASMLNYDRDKLRIFPMWNVTTDGSRPEMDDYNSGYCPKVDPIEIKNSADINKISNMFTVNPWNTPFEPITEAHEYLKRSSADEKWLIVLTDGAFNEEARRQLADIDLQKRLPALASREIKVQYLGFDEAIALQSDEANNFYAKKSSNTSLKDDLIAICNFIFQRSILENRLSGEKLKLDLSMKNLIVFAQGANAKILSLKDSSGREIPITLDSGQRKYSEVKANLYENSARVDKNLAGPVVTFAACSKGEYTLSYTGADKIEIFYEPDVDIDISIVNKDGQRIENADEMITGEYTVTSRLVDAVTGEDVTNHELLGNNVKMKTYFKPSKDAEFGAYENGGKINMEPQEGAELYVEGEYLGKYKITSKDDPRLAWLSGFTVIEPTATVKVDLKSESDWFVMKEKDQWEPMKVTLTLDGQPMTEEQLAATKLTVQTTKDLKYKMERIPGEAAYYIYIARDEAGNFVDPGTGTFKVTASATYTDEFGKDIKSNSDKVSFEIQTYAKIWKIMFWVIIFLIIFALWLMYMLQKVLPKKIERDTASFVTMSSGEFDANFVNVEYRRKGKSLTITGSNAVDYTEQCSATFNLKAVDNHFTAPKRRRIAIVGMDSCCDEVKVSSTKYINYEGRWIKATDLRKAENGKEVPPIYQEVGTNPRYELSRSGGLATLTCKTKTTK